MGSSSDFYFFFHLNCITSLEDISKVLSFTIPHRKESGEFKSKNLAGNSLGQFLSTPELRRKSFGRE